MRKMKLKFFFTTLLFLFILFFTVLYYEYKINTQSKHYSMKIETYKFKIDSLILNQIISEQLIIDTLFEYYISDSISISRVYNSLLILKVKHPDLVMKQFILETGYLTSSACLKQNNLGGYMRRTSDSTYGIRHFDHWIDCIIYTKLFQTKYYDETRFPNYYDFLRYINYAEGDSILGIDEYFNRLKRIPLKNSRLN